MAEIYQAVRVTDKVYWVGAIDWKIRDFHGYDTPRGSTYNAYLVMGEKIALLDAVKEPFKAELMSRIRSIIDPERIDYIVSNHSEPDHTGCLARVIRKVKPEKVFASKMGKKALYEHYAIDVEAVSTGNVLDLGGLSLKFIETRMIHWPDSMVTYIPEVKALISQDAFGMHYATGERFADQLDEPVLRRESDKYYANIVLPYSPIVKNALESLASLDIDLICPDHGPIWRSKEWVGKVLGWYGEYVEQKPTMKAVVIFDSMWSSTEKMAQAIAEGLIEGTADVRMINLHESPRSQVAHELLSAGALLVGSPTINNGIFPTVADVMTYIEGLKPKNLLGAAFGSYGWSGEAVGVLENTLDRMGVERTRESIKVNYVPTGDDLLKCRELGVNIARDMAERI
ncbi:MAG TPA: FprA family A-type flavoprotein [candidate division Zixibacteria bacterium]|nr:FprA family A-type flavoprotein [candidate division Zixibacteria bacterium]